MQRRSFLSLVSTAASAAACGRPLTHNSPAVIHPLPSGEDRLDEAHNLGIASIAFKVLTRETNGALFIIEHTTRQKGGIRQRRLPIKQKRRTLMDSTAMLNPFPAFPVRSVALVSDNRPSQHARLSLGAEGRTS